MTVTLPGGIEFEAHRLYETPMRWRPVQKPDPPWWIYWGRFVFRLSRVGAIRRRIFRRRGARPVV